MAEYRQRAGAGAVLFFRAVAENPFEQIVVLIHGVALCGIAFRALQFKAFSSRPCSSKPGSERVFSGRTGQPTAAIRPGTSIIPGKMTIRSTNDKGRTCVPPLPSTGFARRPGGYRIPQI